MQMLATTALSTAVALMLTTTMPTAGTNAPPDTDSDIQKALESQPEVFMDTASIPEGQVDVSGGVITAPASGHAEIELSFPLKDLEQVGVSAQSENEDFAVAVMDEGDGAFRALLHIPDASSPTEYRFEIDGDFELVPLEDGGITVRTADGELASVISAPWASDANGAPVETDYVIEGNSVVQRVHTSSATQGSGANRIRVIVDNKTGNIITVTKG